MPYTRTAALTCLALLCFAGNSLLCRVALKQTSIDAASFTSIRLISGAIMLWLLVSLKTRMTNGDKKGDGNWISALTLFVYAAGFSFAYISLTAATGALLLFGAVQATMISYGLWQGERLPRVQLAGFVLALGGLIGLLLPGLSAPPLFGSLLMLTAGISWGIYSLRAKGVGDPIHVTTGNFVRTIPFAVGLSMAMYDAFSLDTVGVLCAIGSGAFASGVGYAIWYTALPMLKATTAATVQLSVPVIASVGGVVLLREPLNLRIMVASICVLGGIAIVILDKRLALKTQRES
jgi:drug/metabolite transporter (DMT)-like permease